MTYLQGSQQVRNCLDKFICKIDPLQVQYIKKAQAQFLRGAEQIKNCPNHLIRWIHLDQVQFVTEEQAAYLRGADQIERCPNAFIPNIHFAQVQYILPSQAGKLSGREQIQLCPSTKAHIRNIASRNLCYLNHPLQLRKVSFDRLRYLKLQQLRLASQRQLALYFIGTAILGATASAVAIASCSSFFFSNSRKNHKFLLLKIL